MTEERRRVPPGVQEQIDLLAKRVTDMETEYADLRTAVDKNTALTESVFQNTRDLVEWTNNSVGAFKVLAVLGSVARWAAAIAGACAAIYAAWAQMKGS